MRLALFGRLIGLARSQDQPPTTPQRSLISTELPILQFHNFVKDYKAWSSHAGERMHNLLTQLEKDLDCMNNTSYLYE